MVQNLSKSCNLAGAEKLTKLIVVGTTFLGILTTAGCSKSVSKDAGLQSPDKRHILQMAGIYKQYLFAHNNKPPASTDALKEWAIQQGKDKLKIPDSVEDALVSPRDKEPYHFVPPTKGPKRGPQTFMVYEKTGVKGKHLVAGEMANVGEWTDKEVEEGLEAAK